MADMMDVLMQSAPELAAYSAMQVSAFVVCLALVRRLWPKHTDPCIVADTMTSCFIFPALAAAAISATMKLQYTPASRWTGVVPESRFFLLLYISRGLVHIPMQAFEDISRDMFILMTLHHVLSIVCFGSGLVTGRMHFWGCLDGCCEMSTVFLNHLYLCKELTIGTERLQDVMPTFFAINGLGLWLSFLVFRIILFPAWLWFWYADVTAYPELSWNASTALERYMYPAVTLFLLLLSLNWFVPITKGMLKATGLMNKGTDKGKKG